MAINDLTFVTFKQFLLGGGLEQWPQYKKGFSFILAECVCGESQCQHLFWEGHCQGLSQGWQSSKEAFSDKAGQRQTCNCWLSYEESLTLLKALISGQSI